ncbi:type II toxin-antitoxin system YhaV family toxin [Stenotrophomonas maltophilia group sp. P373]|uniref:type II toxin-antitoxin system YhaV family toxin n=1 Tax=Stenotrophomonas TaxID=40323 RepID=UPI000DA9606B|nr:MULTISPECIES: type II toxin-antitoxin system YhaV family toxin [Stenotrophomonas]AYA91179.1 hypothetical protein PEM_10655 [Stenotrophomonas sp. Pemsol]MCU1006099.1 type II toxin-antitoxin system YhaV family toxin [Stenotrophomonas maltophilia]
MIVKGWKLKAHRLFLEKYEQLLAAVERKAEDDPEGFADSPDWKLLDRLDRVIFERVPQDPTHVDYVVSTLGRAAWRRVKGGMPSRYRLFFQFRSDRRTIIYAWYNDENTLRKAGARTDVYVVFKALLKRGTVPSDFEELERHAASLAVKS